MHPSIVVLAGPNGAGKTSAAPRLLRDKLSVQHFVNADTIASGLSAFSVESAALAAGRIMLERLQELASLRHSFAFETTLASRTFAPWLKKLVGTGYEFRLIFLWLPSAEIAMARVARRVQLGGHDIPVDTIRRRYVAGLRNFFSLYQPIASSWRMYDNSREGRRRLIAVGSGGRTTRVLDSVTWQQLSERYAR